MKDTYARFRCTKEELEQIKSLSKKLGYDNVSEYMSTVLLSGISKKERIELYNHINDLRKRNAMVENNINQIAKHLNIHKNLEKDKLDEYLKSLNHFSIIRKQQTETINNLINILYDS